MYFSKMQPIPTCHRVAICHLDMRWTRWISTIMKVNVKLKKFGESERLPCKVAKLGSKLFVIRMNTSSSEMIWGDIWKQNLLSTTQCNTRTEKFNQYCMSHSRIQFVENCVWQRSWWRYCSALGWRLWLFFPGCNSDTRFGSIYATYFNHKVFKSSSTSAGDI